MPPSTEGSVKYPNGREAFVFMQDQSGFAYYPSGKPAVCVSNVNDYQSTFYFYVDGNKRDQSLVGCFDEHAVGFVVDASRGPKHGTRLVLTKTGGLLSNELGSIEKEWQWANEWEQPTQPITVQLTPAMTFTFMDRFKMTVAFKCENAMRDFDCGAKLRRFTSYLDSAQRITTGPQAGRLEVRTDDAPTLLQRQASLNDAMKAQRNRLNPRSQDLHGQTSDIVAGLEGDFDGYKDGHVVLPHLDVQEWKTRSLEATLSEIPRVQLTGDESGPLPGFGDTLYCNKSDFDPSATTVPSRLLKPNGAWQGEVEVRNNIRRENPLLVRSHVLNGASGRYTGELVVRPGGAGAAPGASRARATGGLGGQTSVLNPTGKAETLRTPLRRVRAADLEDFVFQAGPQQLVTVVCVRDDDRSSRQANIVAEIVHGMLHRGGGGKRGGPDYDPDTAELRMVKVDMAESRLMVRKYNIKTTPFLLMFFGGRMIYGGTLGGEAVRSGPEVQPWRVLLVEPSFKDQLTIEKLLKKRRHLNLWDLCMTGTEAVAHIQRLAASGGANQLRPTYDLVMISDEVPDLEVAMIERSFKTPASRRPAGGGGGGGGSSRQPQERQTLIVGMLSGRGHEGMATRAQVGWEKGGLFTRDTAVLPGRLATFAEIVVNKPIKTSQLQAMDEIMQRRRVAAETGREGSHDFVGMTAKSLLGAMRRTLEIAQRGKLGHTVQLAALSRNESDLGRTLSSQETTLRGVKLDGTALAQFRATGPL